MTKIIDIPDVNYLSYSLFLYIAAWINVILMKKLFIEVSGSYSHVLILESLDCKQGSAKILLPITKVISITLATYPDHLSLAVVSVI